MITGITGKVGGGKSVLALYQMLAYMARGGPVASNIELDLERVDELLWRRKVKFDPSQFTLLDLREDVRFHLHCGRGADRDWPVRVYLDEAHLFYGADDHRELAKEYKDVKSFISQSRKVCVDVVFITQAWENLWAQFRKHALFVYECRDMRAMRLGWLLSTSLKLPILGEVNLAGLQWVKRDVASGEVLESGRSRIDLRVLEAFSTTQTYDLLMDEMMRSMPERKRVGDNRVRLADRVLRWQAKRGSQRRKYENSSDSGSGGRRDLAGCSGIQPDNPSEGGETRGRA